MTKKDKWYTKRKGLNIWAAILSFFTWFAVIRLVGFELSFIYVFTLVFLEEWFRNNFKIVGK